MQQGAIAREGGQLPQLLVEDVDAAVVARRQAIDEGVRGPRGADARLRGELVEHIRED